MPLHLLGKKSWNVYNTSNISQVRADEAAAALRQEERDRLTQEQDALVRTAILRGEEPPTFAPLSPEDDSSKRPRKPYDDSSLGLSREDRKRLRKGRDEDETSHAIRVAQITRVTGSRASLALQEAEKSKKRNGQDKEEEVQITDHAGHIQLFAPPDETQLRKNQKNEEYEKEKKRKEKALEDQYTMRFSNAAGFNQDIGGKPWYAAAATTMTTTSTSKSAAGGDEAGETARMGLIGALGQSEKDVWGRPDPARKEREEKRSSASDPFAFMQKAQGMLKQSERDREKWRLEREKELLALRKAEEEDRIARRREREARKKEKEERRARRERDGYRDRSRDRLGRERTRESHHREDKRRRESVGSLEGFSLDAPAQKDGAESKRSREDHDRNKRRHSRERNERERHGSRVHGHRHERERSRHGEERHRSSRHENSHRRRSRSPRRE